MPSSRSNSPNTLINTQFSNHTSAGLIGAVNVSDLKYYIYKGEFDSTLRVGNRANHILLWIDGIKSFLINFD